MTTSSFTHLRSLAALATVSLVAACGGGGGDGGSTTLATVSSTGVGAPRYGQSLLMTLNGANLDTGIVLASAGCRSMTRSTTAPNLSTATTAYYTCTPSALGAQSLTVTRTLDSAVLTTAAFTVPPRRSRWR